MPTSQETLSELCRLYQSPRKYEFIRRSHAALAETAEAPELARLTLRCLCELGLGGPALELLQNRRDLGLSAAERTTLRASCAALPNGRIPWSECEQTFRNNLAALARGRPQWQGAGPRLQAAVASLQLYRSVQGSYFLSRRDPGGLRVWLADLGGGEAEPQPRSPPRGRLGPTAVIGARVGTMLERIHQDTCHVALWYSHPLYLLEPDPACFAAWLHCEDHSAWLGDERVYVLVGPDVADQCIRLLERKRGLLAPTRLVNYCPQLSVAEELRAATQRLAARERAEFRHLQDELEERYRDRNAAYWAARFRPPGPVFAISSRYTTMLQYSARDALAALEEQGYATHLLLEASDHEQLRRSDICRAVLELDPLVVISIDHGRHEMPFLPRNLPFLCWIQDQLPELLCRGAGEAVGPFDLVCGYCRERCITEFGYPADRFLSVVVPVSTRIFHDGPLDAESAARYGADLCYVGHGSEPLEAVYQNARSRYPIALHPHLEEVYRRVCRVLNEQQAAGPEIATGELIRSISGDGGIRLTEFAYQAYDRGRRHQTLEWAAAWARRHRRRLRIYGRGWEKHPALGQFAAGPVEHGEPLRQAYRGSALTLQLMPEGYLHQRAFEALASGCLPLTRYCPADFAGRSVEAFLAERPSGRLATSNAAVFPGLERVVFGSPTEFSDLAEKYLSNTDQRVEVLGELRAVVLRNFTYTAIMQQIMNSWRASIERLARSSG